MPEHDYIANCIWRIFAADCSPAKSLQRCKDIADAVRIAADAGEKAAHAQLQDLMKFAEDGGYA
jgi:hypothetical protein